MKPFAFEEATLADLGARMASGELTAAALASAYLDRIRDIDQAGPRLRAVIELNPDALAIAEALDRERKAGRVRGPLHGIAVLVKDNIASGDKMSTSAGSLALDGVRAARDAPV
ncbi:MAG TPA: amidase family protein, partial [Usitatibacter sp.]